MSKKKSSAEDLVQKYLNSKNSSEKKMLVMLIRRIKPDWKEPK